MFNQIQFLGGHCKGPVNRHLSKLALYVGGISKGAWKQHWGAQNCMQVDSYSEEHLVASVLLWISENSMQIDPYLHGKRHPRRFGNSLVLGQNPHGGMKTDT